MGRSTAIALLAIALVGGVAAVFIFGGSQGASTTPRVTPAPSESGRAGPEFTAKSAVESVEVLSTLRFFDAKGFMHVTGEVRNTGRQNLVAVRIAVSFLDQAERTLEERVGSAMLDIIPVGAKAPFKIVASQPDPKIVGFRVRVAAAEFTPNKPVDFLALDKLSSARVSPAIWIVKGEILNQGSSTCTALEVIASAYDAAGKLVAAERNFAERETCGPGQAVPFSVVIEANVDRIATVVPQVQARILE